MGLIEAINFFLQNSGNSRIRRRDLNDLFFSLNVHYTFNIRQKEKNKKQIGQKSILLKLSKAVERGVK